MEKEIGRVERYFSGIGVMAVKLTDSLSVGDRIRVRGRATDFEMVVDSMQIEHKSVSSAQGGDDVGIKVPQKVRVGDVVYKEL